MKLFIILATATVLFTGCEREVVVPGADKVTEKNTTVVVPGAPAAPAVQEKKVESSTSITNSPSGTEVDKKTSTTETKQ